MPRKLYNEDLIKEAVDIVIGDDGFRSAEVIGVIRMLKDQDASFKQQAASIKHQAASSKQQALQGSSNKL
jgi:hypothetical protein